MAFKMKNQSMAKMVKAAGDSRVAMKMKKESAMKLKEKSPMEKELVGKQGNLPPELKAKIEAAPSKMKSAMKKDLPEVRITEKKKEKKKGPRKVTKDLKYPYSKNKFGDLMYKDALVNKREAAKIPDSELYEYNPVKPTKKADSAVPMKSAMKKEGGTITAFGKKYTYANAEEKKALLAKFKTMSQEKKAAKKDKTISFKKSLKKGYTKNAEGNVLYKGEPVPSYRLKDAYEVTSSTGGVVSKIDKRTKMDKEYKVVDKKGGSAVPMKRKTQVDGEQVTASKASGGMFMKKPMKMKKAAMKMGHKKK